MSLARSTIVFAFGTLLSRLTGLLRDRVVLSVFGASETLEAFIVANRIPNLFRELLSEGALSNSFTKVYAEICATDPDRGHKLLTNTLILVGFIGILFVATGILAAPLLVHLSTLLIEGADYSDQFVPLATQLTRILFPFILLMSLASIAMGALHQRGQFLITSTSPIILNIGYIFGAYVLAQTLRDRWGEIASQLSTDPMSLGLALGVLLGGFGQMIFQLAGLWQPVLKEHFRFTFRLPWDSDLKKIFILMAPMVIATSAGPINAQVNLIFATSVGGGALVWLNYSFRLLQLPVGLFGVAASAAVLPALTRAIAKAGGKIDLASSRIFQQAIEIVLWLLTPSVVLLLTSHTELIGLVFQSGKFQAADVAATGQTLFVYSFGLLGYGFIKVLTSFYYATDNTTYPMRVSLSMIAVNLLANVFLVRHFGHYGVAGATATTLMGNAALLFWGLRKYSLQFEGKELLRSIVATAVAGVCAGASILALRHSQMVDTATLTPFLDNGIQLTVAGILIAAVYFFAGMIRWRVGPKGALAAVKNFRRR